jgi:hypothetical protein
MTRCWPCEWCCSSSGFRACRSNRPAIAASRNNARRECNTSKLLLAVRRLQLVLVCLVREIESKDPLVRLKLIKRVTTHGSLPRESRSRPYNLNIASPGARL